jgi:hypothetical protein
MRGIQLIFIEHWLSFLTSPKIQHAKHKHELNKYPILEKAVQLLDHSNYIPGQLLAHNNYINNLMAWNTTMIES